jgi:hypothetical protein
MAVIAISALAGLLAWLPQAADAGPSTAACT